MEIVEEKKKLIGDILKELESMGYVIVGGQSYIQSTSGILCIHPINSSHLVTEISLRLNDSEESE